MTPGQSARRPRRTPRSEEASRVPPWPCLSVWAICTGALPPRPARQSLPHLRPRCSATFAYNDGMPLQNRVTPLGDLIATKMRAGSSTGTAAASDAEGRIGAEYQVEAVDRVPARLQRTGTAHRCCSRASSPSCSSSTRATALAAGHRPCALCRHEDYIRFAAAWRGLHGDIGADAIDVRLPRSGSTDWARSAPPRRFARPAARPRLRPARRDAPPRPRHAAAAMGGLGTRRRSRVLPARRRR